MDIPRTSDAIREDWGTAVEVAPDLFRIRLVNPKGALMVNTYAYVGGGTFALFDPGWPWSREQLEEALVSLGLGALGDVEHFLYTHTHIDHMGLAAVFSHEFDAPHYCWSGAEHELERWHGFQDRMNDWSEWGINALAGEARERARQMYANRDVTRQEQRLVYTHGELSVQNYELLEWGDTVSVGDLTFEWIDARGHDPFHGAFFERERGWLLAGDAVLATPTPISRAMDDDLALYRASLDRLEALDADLLLPGHGVQRGGDLSRAFARARGYVDAYQEQVRGVLESATEPMGIYEIALALTPDGKPYSPSTRWWVHLALVDSHLHELIRLDQAELVDDSDGPRFRAA